MRYPNYYTVMPYNRWMTGAEFTCGIFLSLLMELLWVRCYRDLAPAVITEHPTLYW